MKTFFDTSAFSKRYIEENGSQDVEDYCLQATDVGLSILCATEFISALTRRTRDKSITPIDFKDAKEAFYRDISDIEMIEISNKVIFLSIELIQDYQLKTLDAIQLSCAIEWGCDIFVSSDKQQIKAAKRYGIKIALV